MPTMQVMDRVRALSRTESQRRTWRLVAAVVLPLASCVPGTVVGYYTAFGLTYYRPGESEWIVLLFVTVFCGPVLVLLVVLRKEPMARVAASWFLVAAAGTYLWTSTTFDYDVRQLADTAVFGVFAADNPENVKAITDVQLTVHNSDVRLKVSAAPGSEPLVMVAAPTAPEYGCIEHGTFGGAPAYACPVPRRHHVP